MDLESSVIADLQYSPDSVPSSKKIIPGEQLKDPDLYEEQEAHNILSFYYVEGGEGVLFTSGLVPLFKFSDLDNFEIVRHIGSTPISITDDTAYANAINDLKLNEELNTQDPRVVFLFLLSSLDFSGEDPGSLFDPLLNLDFQIENIEEANDDIANSVIEFFNFIQQSRDQNIKYPFYLKIENPEDEDNPTLHLVNTTVNNIGKISSNLAGYLRKKINEEDPSILSNIFTALTQIEKIDNDVAFYIRQQSVLITSLWKFLTESCPPNILKHLFDNPLFSLESLPILSLPQEVRERTDGKGAFVAVVQNIYESIDYFRYKVFPFVNPPPVTKHFYGLIPAEEFGNFDDNLANFVVHRLSEQFSCLFDEICVFPYLDPENGNMPVLFCLITTDSNDEELREEEDYKENLNSEIIYLVDKNCRNIDVFDNGDDDPIYNLINKS